MTTRTGKEDKDKPVFGPSPIAQMANIIQQFIVIQEWWMYHSMLLFDEGTDVIIDNPDQ